MNNIKYSNNFTILYQLVSKCYNYIGPDDSFEIDYFDEKIEFQKVEIMDMIDNLNKYPYFMNAKININNSSNLSNIYTCNDLNLLSSNLKFKILFREYGNYLYGNTENGFICYISDGINCDIFGIDNKNNKYIFFSDKDKNNPISINLYFDFNYNMSNTKFFNIKRKIKSLDTKIKLLYSDYRMSRELYYNHKFNDIDILKYYFFTDDKNIKFKNLMSDTKCSINDIHKYVEIILLNYEGFKHQFNKDYMEYKNKKKAINKFVKKIENLEWPNERKNYKINDYIKIRFYGKYFFKPKIKEIFSDGTFKLFLSYTEYPNFYKSNLFKLYEKNITNEIKNSLIELKSLKTKQFWVIKKNIYNISWKLFPYEDKTYPIINDIDNLNITITYKNKDIATINGKIEK